MSTLVEELEQAAKRIDCSMGDDCTGRDDGAPCASHAMAARLHARAELLRGFESELRRTDKLPLRPGVLEVFQRLTGPLDTP